MLKELLFWCVIIAMMILPGESAPLLIENEEGVDIDWYVMVDDDYPIEDAKSSSADILEASCGMVRIHWQHDIVDMVDARNAVESKANVVIFRNSWEHTPQMWSDLARDPHVMAYAHPSLNYKYGNFIVVFKDRTEPETLRKLFVHELLHTLGVVHSANKKSVMYPEIDPPYGSERIIFTTRDVSQMLENVGAPPTSLCK